MKHVRLVALVLVGVALIAGGAAFKSARDGRKIDQFKAEAPGLVKMSDAYRADPAYVTGLLDAAMPVAANCGGLFCAVTEESYFTALFQAMVDRARADGKPDVARSLRTYAVGKKFLDVKYSQ
jgi:hypothetical protein